MSLWCRHDYSPGYPPGVMPPAMPQLFICIDCAKSTDAVARGRCAKCYRVWADRKNEGDRGRKRTGSRTAARAEHQALITSKEWRRISKMVRLRDGSCQDCGTTQQLTAHHLVPVRQAPHLALDPSNCVTLCRACHGRRERRAA